MKNKFLPLFLIIFVILIPTLSYAAIGDYVIEYPSFLGNYTPSSNGGTSSNNAVIPTPGDGRTRVLIGQAPLQNRAIWANCTNSNCTDNTRTIEIWSYNGTTLHYSNLLPNFTYHLKIDSYKLGFTNDQRYFVYNKSHWDETTGNRDMWVPEIRKIDITNGTESSVKIINVSEIQAVDSNLPLYEGSVSAREMTYLSGNKHLVHFPFYDDDSDYANKHGLAVIDFSTNTYESLGWYSHDKDVSSNLYISKSPNGNDIYFGINIYDSSSKMKVWEHTNGTTTLVMTTGGLNITNNNSNDEDLEAELLAFNGGYFVAYQEYDDDDESYNRSYFYINGVLQLNTDDGDPSYFKTDEHIGFAGRTNNNGSTSKIFNMSTGQVVFSSTGIKWPSSYDGGDEQRTVTVYKYDESTTKLLYISDQWEQWGSNYIVDVDVVNKNLTSDTLTTYFHVESDAWIETSYFTRDKDKLVWNLKYSSGANQGMYWLDMNDESVHHVLKSNELSISYDKIQNLFYANTGGGVQKIVTFSPIVNREIVAAMIEEAMNSIGNMDLDEIRGAVIDDSGNTAIGVANEVKAMLSEGGTIYDTLMEVKNKKQPSIIRIYGDGNITVTNTDSFTIVIDALDATQYKYRLDNGTFSNNWINIGNGKFTVNNLSDGMHTVYVLLRNGINGEHVSGKVVFFKMSN